MILSLKKEADFLGGRFWNINYETYTQLAKESEYASWLYIWGFCPNHFTVSVNHLKNFSNLRDVNNLLKEQGYKLNSSGGDIKGSPSDLLEQSSIMADKIEIDFGDRKAGQLLYEFAKRYLDQNKQLYQGFVTSSADKIFESTNK